MPAFALILTLAAAAVLVAAHHAPLQARDYLRLAAALYAALGVAEGFALAPDTVTDIAATLGAPVLALAAYAACRRAPSAILASLLLVIAALCAVCAAAMDWRGLAAVPQLAAAAALIAIARQCARGRARLYLALAGLGVVGAAAAALVPGHAARAGVLLFAAAGLLGVAVASVFAVEHGGRQRRDAAIGGGR